MMYELSQQFFFEAAHTLDREHERAGSLRVHGHTYHAEVTVLGMPNPNTGMIVDLEVLRKAVSSVRNKLDHQLLDNVKNIGPATLENLCAFVCKELESMNLDLKISSVLVERRATGDRCILHHKNN